MANIPVSWYFQFHTKNNGNTDNITEFRFKADLSPPPGLKFNCVFLGYFNTDHRFL